MHKTHWCIQPQPGFCGIKKRTGVSKTSPVAVFPRTNQEKPNASTLWDQCVCLHRLQVAAAKFVDLFSCGRNTGPAEMTLLNLFHKEKESAVGRKRKTRRELILKKSQNLGMRSAKTPENWKPLPAWLVVPKRAPRPQYRWVPVYPNKQCQMKKNGFRLI